jgi:hypothetical protein
MSALAQPPTENSQEDKDLTEAILQKFEQMGEELDEKQFQFVVKYILSREFRAKVHEEKKLTDVLDQADTQGVIDQKFGDAENAKLIWEVLEEDRRVALFELALTYPL